MASLWIRQDDSFRFGTETDYYSRGQREQIQMTDRSKHNRHQGIVGRRGSDAAVGVEAAVANASAQP